MKFQIILVLVLVGMALGLPSKKVKGRRADIGVRDLKQNERPSKGRYFYSKGTQSSQPNIYILELAPPTTSSLPYTDTGEEVTVEFTGDITVENGTRSNKGDDDDRNEDEIEKPSRKNKKRKNNNLKHKKMAQKKQAHRSNVAISKGASKMRLVRLDGNGDGNSNLDISAIRRLLQQK